MYDERHIRHLLGLRGAGLRLQAAPTTQGPFSTVFFLMLVAKPCNDSLLTIEKNILHRRTVSEAPLRVERAFRA
jgi:hypothetical protein